MDRRQFSMLFLAAFAGSKPGWTRPSAVTAPAAPLYLAFRSGVSEFRCGEAFQNDLRSTIAALRDAGYAVQAGEWGTDDTLGKWRLSGTCRLSVDYFPPRLAPILADWLRPNRERYICAALGKARTVACNPEEALAITTALYRSTSKLPPLMS